ncbi:hypothetical protein NEOLEDRAFT_1154372 [Neolentinus lepideus HHB14362 ss-1]|uniref:DNA repair protein Crb2 Tudor domain-containing protein n=1 Tax=Neolentinus lepideus HHB14362 ss-1 TaxID=1314782 RepID=A0A165UNE2_9AGAM|nr:hypothetical protein NEOLEDRAFT_1154372 [Neolentinus lepideus HHB14362 ss-1]
MTPGTRRLREPTRVFALWKQDGHYYPGVIHASTLEPNRYIVHFDDGTAETVEVAKMRRCQLGKGDNVLIGKGQRAKVLDAQGSDSNSMVRVEVDDRDGTENVEVTVGDIQIAGRTITSHWKDRLLVPSAIVTVQQSKMKQSPSVSHAQDMLNKAIYKTGFVISSSSTSPQVEKEKADAVSIIKTAGGVLVDDWSSVVSIDGQFSSSGNCWVAYRSGVKWSGSDDIAKIFLLSDDCTTKPKFLMALALGVPCLDIRWILAPGELDWPAYLLPAGYSESIQARISQMVDLDWGNSIDYVEDIMNNPVATKLFGNKSILCLSDKFVPIQAHVTKKKTITDGRGSLTCVPRILLAMGAIRVEAVVQTRYATERNLKAYHYIIVSELSDIDPLRGDGLSVAHWDWVKDCLISGRLLDMPA